MQYANKIEKVFLRRRLFSPSYLPSNKLLAGFSTMSLTTGC
ncbi:hypothetical protein BMG_4398 [Priestia megaterium]|nr:hypothetical protein BMG_4398 [Priestia megaterium]